MLCRTLSQEFRRKLDLYLVVLLRPGIDVLQFIPAVHQGGNMMQADNSAAGRRHVSMTVTGFATA